MVAIRMLQVCRAVVHNKRVITDDADDFQDKMANFGMILPVTDLLSDASNDMVREAIAFLVCILDDGNPEAQKGFLAHFLGTREETFFLDVSSRIRDAMENIVEVFSYHLFIMHALKCVHIDTGFGETSCKGTESTCERIGDSYDEW